MAIDRIVLSLMIGICGAAALQGAAFAEDRGTLEQQMACTPDVWRLCSDRIPDVNRIVGCLRQNSPQLSAPCRAVFESNNALSSNAMPQTPLPRGRMAPPPPPRPDDEDDE